MKNFLSSKANERLAVAKAQPLQYFRWAFCVVLLLVMIGGAAYQTSKAQRLGVPVKVSDVSSHTSATGTVVTITADGALTKAQTWHDDEGYHVVLPNTVSDYSLKLARGVKLRRVGSSLEVLVQTKPGARVSMQPGQNQISLAVEGKLTARPVDPTFQTDYSSPEEKRLFEEPQVKSQEVPSVRLSAPLEDPTANSQTGSNSVSEPATTVAAQAPTQVGSNQIVPQGDGSTPRAVPSEIKVQDAEEGFLASIFSGTSVLIVFALGLVGLLMSRKLRSKQTLKVGEKHDAGEQWENLESLEKANQPQAETSTSLVKATDIALRPERQSVARMTVAGPTSLYGAYRIDQEVGKLIFGQAHRIDVLASRAPDDRRAIETSLIKGVNSSEFDEVSKRRAREALEEYGFVARQCAALLLSPDAFDRTSAARALGEIRSAAALPFLLESLYDSESIVRNQAVVSIGELKLPSAIGALLDIARTHPDVPSSLLSRTLSACSVEGLDFLDAEIPQPSLLEAADIGSIIEAITHLEPATSVENLPESDPDERLTQALSSLESIDVEERGEALKTLFQFRVQSAVDAVSKVARHDSEPTIRSLAISGLGSMDHESVFSAILIGMADESREVRASAARSLNRLSFDRADAYVRVIETGDEETIRNVAKACINSGIVSQNLDRLSNSDHRQAYETFSLICLLAKAQMNQPVLDAISDHPRIDVRLKAVHLLACTAQKEVFDDLRELALKDGMNEVIKTALLEAMYKLDQIRAQTDESLEDCFEFHNDATVVTAESSADATNEVTENSFEFTDNHNPANEDFVSNGDMFEIPQAAFVEPSETDFVINNQTEVTNFYAPEIVVETPQEVDETES